jgi:hypothetical protein
MDGQIEEGKPMGTIGTGTGVTMLASWSRRGAQRADRRHHHPRRRLIGVPAAGTEDFRLWTEWIGRCLATTGTADVDAHLADFARAALELGVEPMHAHVVADPTSSELARARAFFKVAMRFEDEHPDPPAA